MPSDIGWIRKRPAKNAMIKKTSPMVDTLHLEEGSVKPNMEQIINRAEAKAAGLKYYYTGNPCKNGHVAPRFIGGFCTECAKDRKVAKAEDLRKYYAARAQTDAFKLKQKVSYQMNRERRLQAAAEYRTKVDPDKQTAYRAKYRAANSERLKQDMAARGRLPVKFERFGGQLTVDDAPLSDEHGLLLVACWYCGKYFMPTRMEVRARIQAIRGQNAGEARIYCSDGCKQSCPTYGQKKYPLRLKQQTSREMSAVFRKQVLARDQWVCQRCGEKEAALHAHHIIPYKMKYDSMDVKNGITLCVKCHQKAHKEAGCRPQDIHAAAEKNAPC